MGQRAVGLGAQRLEVLVVAGAAGDVLPLQGDLTLLGEGADPPVMIVMPRNAKAAPVMSAIRRISITDIPMISSATDLVFE